MIIITVVNCVNDPLFLQSYYTPIFPEAARQTLLVFLDFQSSFWFDYWIIITDRYNR